jgi:hypothetical protein
MAHSHYVEIPASLYMFNNHTNEEGGKVSSKDYQRSSNWDLYCVN